MGSDSDAAIMSAAAEVLTEFGVTSRMTVASAHRSPARVLRLISEAHAGGVLVFIVGAGAAAHLAGVVAAHTTRPVIGVPIDSSALKGLDALLSTVQMPPGVPVATVAIGRPGATNAGVLAAQMIALADPHLAERLRAYKVQLEERVEAAAKRLVRRRPRRADPLYERRASSELVPFDDELSAGGADIAAAALSDRHRDAAIPEDARERVHARV
jgi:phosphoribosylamine--glycine ligase